MMTPGYNLDELRLKLLRAFREVDYIRVGEWQSQDVSDKPEMDTKELNGVTYWTTVPDNVDRWAEITKANLPWAEDHFLERVCGEPLNPPPSEQWWPFAQQGNKEHKEGERFSHTYPERIWPKFAGVPNRYWYAEGAAFQGIRYQAGDLSDVIDLLSRSPFTRQAYLPIWFPEDTGNVPNVRVPCSIGYHFLMRNQSMDCYYTLRSCDYLRHWADDVYMAGRLLQHVVGKLQGNGITVQAGSLHMTISSLHVFRGDEYRMKQLLDEAEDDTVIYGTF